MADQITQQLTFDASQAISELGRLNEALTGSSRSLDTFGKSLASFNKTASGTAGVLSGVAQSASVLRNSLGGGLVPSQALQGVKSATGLVDQYGNALTAQASAATTTVKANDRAAASTTRVGRAARNAKGGVNELTVSFQTLGRILATRLAVSAFAGLIRGLGSAASSAIEFQKRIAEIQSISTTGFQDFEKSAEAVRSLSDAFNQPLGEVQEGLYQVISNQIQGATNQILLLEEASKLAKVGVADLSDTVSLLTGTINAFQLNAAQSGQVAAVFFETVRLGRVRIEELANSFGTVAPLAAEAGVSFEELAAAFATVTVNGVDASKAATQLRGIINAFLKPTKELAAVLEAAGFSSGELAIQTLGLGGALALIQQASGGSTTEIAKLIPRVRGLAGALVLAREDGESLADTVEQLRNASADLLQEKLDIRLETNAEDIEKQLNAVSNALTVDLGQALLDATKLLLEFSGGASTLVPIIKTLTPLIIGVGTAGVLAAAGLAVYTVAAKAASAANTLLATTSRFALRGLLSLGVSNQIIRALLAFASSAVPITIGFAIGAAIGFGLDNALVERAKVAAKKAGDELKREFLKTSQLAIDFQVEQQETAAQIKGIRDVVKEQQAALNDTKQLVQQRTELFIQSNSTILADTQRLFGALTSANKKLIGDLEKERDAASDAEKSSLERQADLRTTIEDRAFNQSIKRLNDRQRLFALEAQGTKLAAQANRELATARTEADTTAALDKLQRAEGFLEEADAIAESSGNLADQTRLFRQRQNISRSTLRSEQEQAGIQAQIKSDAEAALRVEEKRVAELNRQVKEANDAISALQKAKTLEEQITAARAAREEVADITPELAFGAGQLDFDQLVSFTKFRDNLTQSIENSGIDNTVGDLLGGVGLQQLTNKFTQETTAAMLKAIRDAEAAASEQGIELNVRLNLEQSSIANLQSAIDELINAGQGAQEGVRSGLDESAEVLARTAAAQAALKEAIIEANNFGAILTNVFGLAATAASSSFDTFAENLDGIREKVKLVAQDFGNISADEADARLRTLQQELDTLRESATIPQTAARQIRLTEIQAVIDKLNSANESGLDKANQDAQQINQELGQTPQAAAGVTSQMQASLTVAQQIKSTIESIQVPTVSGAAATAAKGKFFPKFLAGGGFSPKGTDTIPAMLSPGEFVVNARSSRRFFSQLQAINAGVQPVYRQEGGPVTSVGDINVTVTSGQDSEGTGRTIARRIRRELRRGTSTL